MPSTAITTRPTSERGSFGARTSWYDGSPATITLACTETRVVLPTAAITWLAACCGVSGVCGTLGATCLAWSAADGTNSVTESLVESQSHTLDPSAMTSVSDSGCGIDSR